MKKPKSMVYPVLLSLILLAGSAQAKDEVQELKDQIKVLQKRIEELEAQNQSQNQSQNQNLNQNQNNIQAQNQDSKDFWDRDWQSDRFFGANDAFDEFERMQQEMNRIFNNSFHRMNNMSQDLDERLMGENNFEIKEDDQGYVIELDTSHLNKDQIDIKVNPHSITLSGQYSEKKEENNPQGFVHSAKFGSFTRTIPLPIDADVDKMVTEMNDDKIIIKIPKSV